MRKNQTSISALGIAMCRALESDRTEQERICYDPYARLMIPGWFFALGKFFTNTGYAEIRGPGVMGFLTARERYIDDFLLDRAREGFEQLVILGAGYDSRAYRFADLLSHTSIFEVDHPATQMDKLARLKKIFGRIPGQVNFVPVDFNTQALDQRLLECGYRPDRVTCFIWQGVVYYLDAASVDHTLQFITRFSAPGSSVIFDYVYQSVLDSARGHGEVSGMRRYRGLTGEGLTFGIPEGTVKAFLQERGFTGVRNIDSQDLKPLYFSGKNAKRKVVSGYGIVSAQVAETGK